MRNTRPSKCLLIAYRSLIHGAQSHDSRRNVGILKKDLIVIDLGARETFSAGTREQDGDKRSSSFHDESRRARVIRIALNPLRSLELTLPGLPPLHVQDVK